MALTISTTGPGISNVESEDSKDKLDKESGGDTPTVMPPSESNENDLTVSTIGLGTSSDNLAKLADKDSDDKIDKVSTRTTQTASALSSPDHKGDGSEPNLKVSSVSNNSHISVRRRPPPSFEVTKIAATCLYFTWGIFSFQTRELNHFVLRGVAVGSGKVTEKRFAASARDGFLCNLEPNTQYKISLIPVRLTNNLSNKNDMDNMDTLPTDLTVSTIGLGTSADNSAKLADKDSDDKIDKVSTRTTRTASALSSPDHKGDRSEPNLKVSSVSNNSHISGRRRPPPSFEVTKIAATCLYFTWGKFSFQTRELTHFVLRGVAVGSGKVTEKRFAASARDGFLCNLEPNTQHKISLIPVRLTSNLSNKNDMDNMDTLPTDLTVSTIGLGTSSDNLAKLADNDSDDKIDKVSTTTTQTASALSSPDHKGDRSEPNLKVSSVSNNSDISVRRRHPPSFEVTKIAATRLDFTWDTFSFRTQELDHFVLRGVAVGSGKVTEKRFAAYARYGFLCNLEPNTQYKISLIPVRLTNNLSNKNDKDNMDTLPTVLTVHTTGLEESSAPDHHRQVPSESNEKGIVSEYISKPVAITLTIGGLISLLALATGLSQMDNGQGTPDTPVLSDVIAERSGLRQITDAALGLKASRSDFINTHATAGYLEASIAESGTETPLGTGFSPAAIASTICGILLLLALAIGISVVVVRRRKKREFDFNVAVEGDESVCNNSFNA